MLAKEGGDGERAVDRDEDGTVVPEWVAGGHWGKIDILEVDLLP